VEAFLREGDPPLVFTLGSFVVGSAGSFYDEAATISRRLGRRAILLTGQGGAPRRAGGCLILNYAPHSALFPHAAAVIHHGGIGTTGQALRAGRVQLVVPHFGDQFDNAERVRSAGMGLAMRRERFRGDAAADALARILSSAAMAAAADRAARIVAAEDDAETAAQHILMLRRPS
jgi:UDP:flavonoid glycosyltransferase YjiC (YdhE family)